MNAPVCLIRYTREGGTELSIFGDGEVRFLVVDELAPHDRIFEVTTRFAMSDLGALVGDDETIGSKDDARHQAAVARIEAAREGRAHLRPVE